MSKKQEVIMLLSENLGVLENNFNSKAEAFKQLSNCLNDLIINDFIGCCGVDISEKK